MKDFQDRYSPMFRAVTRDAGHCPPAGSLADLAAGRTWPWQRRRLVEHLSQCSDCSDDYHVLVTARGGLVTALEEQGHDGEGLTGGWLRPGLVAAAALGVVALSISVLVQSDAPAPVSGHGVLFASEFEHGPGGAERQPGQDRLFISDFGETEGEGGKLFRDDFGG
ncbi:MAG TPA: hypothetical protein VJ902_08105 [Wenzhouxiangellaceae bacterium]|nr:hypothetical protein [Wenzhouxiangellaceae bacterium]